MRYVLPTCKAARPVDVSDENNYIKVFLSREGLKVEFDEENKKITVLTPAGNEVVLDDTGQTITVTDQSGNTAKFETGGITVNSIADMTLEATGNITIKAGGNVTAQGINVECKASASFVGQGGAAADLKGGMVNISGPLVKIN